MFCLILTFFLMAIKQLMANKTPEGVTAKLDKTMNESILVIHAVFINPQI